MLIVTLYEFNNTPLYCIDELVYKRIRREFARVLGSEILAEILLKKFWHYTLRQLSCTSAVNVMSCFILLQEVLKMFKCPICDVTCPYIDRFCDCTLDHPKDDCDEFAYYDEEPNDLEIEFDPYLGCYTDDC